MVTLLDPCDHPIHLENKIRQHDLFLGAFAKLQKKEIVSFRITNRSPVLRMEHLSETLIRSKIEFARRNQPEKDLQKRAHYD